MKLKKYESGFRKLIAWRESHKLTLMNYRATTNFPRDELFGVTSQIRRATSSVEAQLAEGSRMPTKKHRKIYYDRAYASLAEVDCFLELAHDLQYLDKDLYEKLLQQLNKASFLIKKLSQSCT